MDTPSPLEPYSSPGFEPAQPPPGPPVYANAQEQTDAEHLRLLSIFYYVFAGFTAVTTLLMVAYFVVVALMFGTFAATLPITPPPAAVPPAAVPPAEPVPVEEVDEESATEESSTEESVVEESVVEESVVEESVVEESVPVVAAPPAAAPPATTPPIGGRGPGAPLPAGAVAMFTGIIIVAGCFALLLNLFFIAAYYFVGRSLPKYRNYVFTLVVAGFTCLQFPIGTALGVCTFIVLLRPSVKAKFNQP